jgi:hypothetical protein
MLALMKMLADDKDTQEQMSPPVGLGAVVE